ncbi:MAG TPA: hypothetical protein VEZ89_15045, partial [Rubrivivax sp.]|nr:hypothetical protein [Rubrivivax sp.]
MSDAVVIVGLGANTALGQGAFATAAAVRAGISGFVQHPYMIDTAGEPMRAAIAPYLDIGLSGVDRFEALLFPPIDEALTALPDGAAHSGRWAIALGLPNARPGLQPDLGKQLLARARRRFGA